MAQLYKFKLHFKTLALLSETAHGRDVVICRPLTEVASVLSICTTVDHLNGCYGRPMEYGGPLFFPCGFFLLSSSFFLLIFSSPNLSGRRLDVYHTSTHGVALVRI